MTRALTPGGRAGGRELEEVGRGAQGAGGAGAGKGWCPIGLQRASQTSLQSMLLPLGQVTPGLSLGACGGLENEDGRARASARRPPEAGSERQEFTESSSRGLARTSFS